MTEDHTRAQRREKKKKYNSTEQQVDYYLSA